MSDKQQSPMTAEVAFIIVFVFFPWLLFQVIIPWLVKVM